MIKIICSFMLIFIISFASSIEEGEDALKNKQYKKALEIFTSIENKNSEAQLKLGVMYYRGLGVKQNCSKSLYWLEKSASQGNEIAQGEIGFYYFNGLCVQQDYKKALELYEKLAERDNMYKMYVASMHLNGLGTRQSYSIAKLYYGLACDDGLQLGCDKYAELNKKGY